MRAVLPFVLVVALVVPIAVAQFGGMGGPKQPTFKPVKSDIPFIKCQVCEQLAKAAFRQVKAARDKVKPGHKLTEEAIFGTVEALTNPMKDEGEWIAKLDIVQAGSKLNLVEQAETGSCEVTCKTIQRAAEDIMEYAADTDVAETLWKGTMTRAQFTSWLCREASSACKSKPPKVPADRKPGGPFKVADPQERQMAKMMASMKEMGMGGQVYDRESAMNMVNTGEEDEDEDDEKAEYRKMVQEGIEGKRDFPRVNLHKEGEEPAAQEGKGFGAAAKEGVSNLLGKVGLGAKKESAAAEL